MDALILELYQQMFNAVYTATGLRVFAPTGDDQRDLLDIAKKHNAVVVKTVDPELFIVEVAS